MIGTQDLNIIKKINLKHPYVWLATWFGCGFLRPGPGTWGSLGSIPPALIIYSYAGLESFLIGLFSIFILGYWASYRFDLATGAHDNKMIVIDEAAGQWIALLPVLYIAGLSPLMVFASFAFFRFFDILKPWPISWVDRSLKGAAGVMLDDVLAGVLAALCCYGLMEYAGFG